ncbi:acyl carrier protein [Streptomyces sp. B8F3]|uniref:acyl carrier protein n=1 Tax=unclassified Streptomyces TaxID=2593676 RepID=UPI00325D70B8
MTQQNRLSGGYEEVLKELTVYVEERFLPAGESGIEPTAPLLELGILTSLNTTELISHIQSHYGVFVPPEKIVGSNFKNLDVITRFVLSIREESSGQSCPIK